VQSASAAQQQLFARTGEWLRASFGELLLESSEEPAYFVRLGPVGVRVNVEAVGEDEAVIEAYSWVARGLRIDAEVGLHLARQNIELRIGSLGIDGEDAIILQHALFADAASEPVLERVVRVLAGVAEQLDDDLRTRFG
jgi:hypothetical protein